MMQIFSPATLLIRAVGFAALLVATSTAVASAPARKRLPAASDTWPASYSEPVPVPTAAMWESAPMDEPKCCGDDAGGDVYFGGVDYLLVRPHFSEAVAYASGSQTLSSYNTKAAGLDFDYDSSLRAFFGYRCANGSEIKFTYWNLQGDVQVDGAASGPGQFIVDPFGNIAGSVTIIDPSDARFGTTIVGGDEISTNASVDLNVYDIDFMFAPILACPNWTLAISAGARIADVRQYYESTITTSAGAPLSHGEFFADFVGAGPKVGLHVDRYFDHASAWSFYADTQTSLLVGSHHVRSEVTPQPGFHISQSETMTRLIPVLETELGISWQPTSYFRVSTGYLFQAWFDLGTSGGTFGGLFSGADDSNIMSFDGLMTRAEFRY